MIKLVGVLLAVVAIAVVMLIFTVTLIHSDSFVRPTSSEFESVELDTTEQSPNNLGLSTEVDFLFERPRWLPGGVTQIIPTVGVNFGFMRPIASGYAFGRSFKVGTSATLSDEELGSTSKHRISFESGMRVYLSPTQYVLITCGRRYDKDSVTTNFKTALRL
ncbi:MAG: hypothetical protein OXP71_02830 [Candidatus Poribacteria bacterium]|nr:hypothetical protein [Candidatus Poribacteria bacterium]